MAVPILDEVLSRLTDGRLSDYGFRVFTEECDDLVRVYVRSATQEQQYVRIGISWDVRDKPWQVLASIGEGRLTMPERDWNAYPVWMLARARTGTSPDYGYESEQDLEEAFERVANDLFTHAQPFLRGDLGPFRSLRAELNESRTPYRVFRSEPHPGEEGPAE